MNRKKIASFKKKLYMSAISVYIPGFLIFIISLTGVDCKKNPVTPPDNLPDTTSHEISWEIDTIGGWQSRFLDVWGSDANNIYAVGFIYISLNPYQATNIMHWDGTKWETIHYLEGVLKSIYGFDKNNIWTCGYWQVDDRAYALIAHWDGKTWKTWKLDEYPMLNALWGISSDNIFACGANGTILKYDGQNWTKMITGVTEDIRSIYGVNKNEIYAVGNTFSNYTWAVLKYDGNNWRKIKESAGTPELPVGELCTVWSPSSYCYYTNDYKGHDSIWSLFGWPSDNTLIDKISGSSENNIFAVGSYDLIMHYNGSTFKRYEFYKKPGGGRFYGIHINGKKVFIAGTSSSKAVIYRGTQQ